MDSLQETQILKFNPDTLETVRKEFGLDKPGQMDQAIDILEEWVKKQEHFAVKSFDRGYLERAIIYCKGSLERAKKKLDKCCTYRTLLPIFFQNQFKEVFIKDDIMVGGCLPRLTKDNIRVFFTRNTGHKFERGFLYIYQLFIAAAEYGHAYDYCSGLIVVFDWRKANVKNVMLTIDIIELQNTMTILTEGLGLRIKGIHFITSSDFINMMVAIIKPAMGAKLADRLHVHKNIEELYDFIPKDLLPADYGGKEVSLIDLYENIYHELTSEKIAKYLSDMAKACTIEDLRQKDEFNNEYLGMAGTFRSLCVD